MDLFASIIQPERHHPQFLELQRSQFHAPARALMNELFQRMGDPNGNFARDFQRDGFHSRVFELACFAYLEEANFTFDRSHARPDFVATRDGFGIAVEAVTANPSTGQATDISLREMAPLTQPEIFQKVQHDVAARITNSLVKKLKHQYEELPHCTGKPLALMIGPFFEAGSAFYSDDALFHPLFGAPEGVEDAQTPFFQRSDSNAISAVLYCNQFTVSRFLRLTNERENNTAFTLIREGMCYRRANDEAHSLGQFRHIVGSGSAPKEIWAEGVTVFENPFATLPLPRGALPASCYVSVQDGYVCREVTAFHPVVSFTRINVPASAI